MGQPEACDMPVNKPGATQMRGTNQSGMRAYNEKLILTLLRRFGALAKSDLTRMTGLSAQTISVIMRALERDGLVLRGEPMRGRIGQPSVPMALDPDGVFSIGLKIGRRMADLVLMDFTGAVRFQQHLTYQYPLPATLMAFLADGLNKARTALTPAQWDRVAGIGVAAPFELWAWLDRLGAPPVEMEAWRAFSFAEAIGEFSDLPVQVENDASCACGAENVFGRGREFSDFAYFFVGTFIGGGFVLNDAIFTGRTGNAGAFGTLPIRHRDRPGEQLIDCASIFILEARLKEAGIDPSPLWLLPDDWDRFEPHLTDWIEMTGESLAIAAVSVCSVIDFEAVLIDGGFPASVRERIASAAQKHLASIDFQGIETPNILPAAIGANARVMGAASLPLFARYLLSNAVRQQDAA
ncbi:ROK family transcriptional regulator [Oricola sp.]|uniref:ROK family transcriptional regulator n=1 Tax=Oricola sp. TaxID=1979950 RepID=UPI0025FBC0DA|nr:ROK family transcriptional regulator [Oricola sp.]MCI5076703.1 ROK family transcriptional regulator [Oricola sp.]